MHTLQNKINSPSQPGNVLYYFPTFLPSLLFEVGASLNLRNHLQKNLRALVLLLKFVVQIVRFLVLVIIVDNHQSKLRFQFDLERVFYSLYYYQYNPESIQWMAVLVNVKLK